MREEPASVGQRLLWLMDHYRGQQHSLNEQVVWHLRGDCDVAALRRAVDLLHERHESLRTTFVARRRQLVQVINPPRPVELLRVDVSGHADPRRAAREHVATELTTAVDFGVWSTRPTLITVGPEHHVFVLTMHHYVSDDWSNALLSRDIRALYQGEELPEVGWQYATWAAWQRERISGPDSGVLADHWRRQLDGARLVRLPERAEVPRGPDEQAWVSVELTIDPHVAHGLHQLARRQRTTLFPVMLSLFYLVLHRATGQSDLTVASLFANRSRPEVRDTVGFFVSMVLLRGRVVAAEPFTDLLRQVRNQVMEGLRHQELPAQLLPPGSVTGEGRTDDVMFQLLGSFVPRADMSGDELDDLEAQLERSRFALEFVVVPQGDALTAVLMCDRDRFTPDWARQFVKDYVALAAAVVTDPQRLPGTPS
ncbi:condensation domain-containing protein [Micromonospora sp. NPDC047467]|uniref:condensation domain-containing protein n=1 Tax=Micromonospora sp. NPDC047467 TaxID=3154814 RepID=UPI0033CAA883